MVHGITWKLYAKMFKLHHFVIKSNGNVIWRYQALGNHQSATLKGFQHKYRFNSPPSAAPSTPGRFRDKVSLIKCSTHILSPSNKDVHNGSRSWWNAFNEAKYFQICNEIRRKATSNGVAPQKRSEKVRKLLPVWRKDDICPLHDIVTLPCLCSHNYFAFLKRLSFLCCYASDVRTCQKWQAWALETLGSLRWNWQIPKTLPRAWREQAGVAFGVKERPFYVPFKCVCTREREISASLLSKGELSLLNASKLFPHTQVFKDISLNVSSSSRFTLSVLLK